VNNSFIKFFVLSACAFATSAAGVASAATYDLTDAMILDQYKLKTADKNSEIQKAELIYNSDNEPNCGGKEIPRLTVAITRANAWDEEGKDNFTTTDALDWNKSLGRSIPYFVNIEKSELAKPEFEDGGGYLGANAVCPYPQSVQLRAPFNTSLKAYLKYLTTSGRTKRVVTQLGK
jgi:hypothetical protein